MGGGAFAQAAAQGEPTLRTPRMSPQTYNDLKKIYTERLEVYFPDCEVACLLEAPEKSDYGDIDFIIATEQQIDMTDLAQHLGARGVINLSSGTFQRCTLAVSPSGEKSERPAVAFRNGEKPSALLSDEVYAQIDIEIVPPERFEWYSFYASYGDMASLLGKFVHYFGFTVTDKGFLLRLQELDEAKAAGFINVDDSSGKILLSRVPGRVMEFLGFSPERYHRGFDTTGEFYEWLGECRLLSPETIKYRRNNSNERSREKKRTVYAGFLEEWLPRHFGIDPDEEDDPDMEDGRKNDVSDKRRQLRDEAIRFFDKEAEFEVMHSALVLSVRNQTAAHLLKPILAQRSGAKDKKLGELLRAFRRWVVFRDDRPVVAERAHTDEESQLHFWLAENQQSLADVDGIALWVEANWEVIKALERQRVKESRPG